MTEFDQKAKDWDKDPTKAARASAVAKAIRENVPLTSDMRVLEYGCGTGLLSFALRGDTGPITLADSSEGMLEVLREKIAATGASGMTALKLDLATDPPPQGQFDLLYTLMTLHHIPEVETILRQFQAMLKPGGWLAICDLDKEDGTFHEEDFKGHKGFNRQELTANLQAAGFKETRITTAYQVERETPEGKKVYPLFLAVARRPLAISE